MKLCECLEYFRDTCDELIRLGTEENVLLRADKNPDEKFLDRKRRGLEHLTDALEELRSLESKPVPGEKARAREVRTDVQQMLMRLMLLSRQNEQLLLNGTGRLAPRQTTPGVKASEVGKFYQITASK